VTSKKATSKKTTSKKRASARKGATKSTAKKSGGSKKSSGAKKQTSTRRKGVVAKTKQVAGEVVVGASSGAAKGALDSLSVATGLAEKQDDQNNRSE